MSSVLKVFQIAFQMLHVKVIHMRQENKEHVRVALEYMGHSFVKVPRVLYARVLSLEKEEKMLAGLHLVLFISCNFDDRVVKLGNNQVVSYRGEYVGTYRELSRLSGIPFGSISRLLEKLEKRELIEIVRVPGGSVIRVNGYDKFCFASEKEYKLRDTAKTSRTNEAKQAEDAAARLSEAEAKIGGRSKQYSNKNVN